MGEGSASEVRASVEIHWGKTVRAKNQGHARKTPTNNEAATIFQAGQASREAKSIHAKAPSPWIQRKRGYMEATHGDTQTSRDMVRSAWAREGFGVTTVSLDGGRAKVSSALIIDTTMAQGSNVTTATQTQIFQRELGAGPFTLGDT